MKKRLIALLSAIFCLLSVVLPYVAEGAEGQKVTISLDLTLSYDDRYVFEKPILSIDTIQVTSRISGSDVRDSAVLRTDGENGVIACGVGVAKVNLQGGETVYVRVKEAKISVIFLLGQSNGEGMTLGATKSVGDLNRAQSVVCGEGQVYSTYAPSQIGWNATAQTSLYYGDNIGGTTFGDVVLTNENASLFVASSLTSKTNANGEPLAYPLNQLTASGNGKTGLDSSIAWTWHEETGEKVWIINAAHSGSSIRTWMKGDTETDNDFWQAVNLGNRCLDVLQNEIEAGHYTFSRMGYYWFQGCANENKTATAEYMTSEEYTEAFRSFHKDFKSELSRDLNGDGQAEGISFAGIFMVHNPITFLTPVDCLLSGVRTAEMYLGSSSEEDFADVYLVSAMPNVWTGDNVVSAYFSERYPDGNLPYPVRTAYRLPTTVSEVHPDIHYRQPGYNEMGYQAVLTTIGCLAGRAGKGTIRILRENGYLAYQEGETITLQKGQELYFGVLSDPLYLLAKGLSVKVNCEGVDCACHTLIASSTTVSGTSGTVTFSIGEKTFLTLKLVVS